MAVEYSRNSTNQDYIKLLKDLGVINNTSSNGKKDIRWQFKTKMMLQNKYQFMS